MLRSFISVVLCGVVIALSASSVVAQDPPLPYGAPIDLKTAKKIAAAAEIEANKNQWPVAIAIVDSGGHLVLFQRLENTQLGSVDISIEKAKTAVLYRRPTKAFEDRIALGGADLKLLKLPGLPLEGGIPIIYDGRIIGAIGVSGVQSSQDAQVGTAGLKSLED